MCDATSLLGGTLGNNKCQDTRVNYILHYHHDGDKTAAILIKMPVWNTKTVCCCCRRCSYFSSWPLYQQIKKSTAQHTTTHPHWTLTPDTMNRIKSTRVRSLAPPSFCLHYATITFRTIIHTASALSPVITPFHHSSRARTYTQQPYHSRLRRKGMLKYFDSKEKKKEKKKENTQWTKKSRLR